MWSAFRTPRSFFEHARPALELASLVSVGIFVGSILLLPVIVARLPEDHFVEHGPSRPGDPGERKHPLVLLGRNVAGAMLLVAGVIMLFVPGPGVVMILAALALMRFPGKKQLERRIASSPRVLPALNRIRAAAKAPPLRFE